MCPVEFLSLKSVQNIPTKSIKIVSEKCQVFIKLSWLVFVAYKLLCYHRRNLFACLARIATLPSRALHSRGVYSFLLHLDPRERTSSPIQDLFCSLKPLTYPGSASVQCGLHGRTDYPLSQALTFFTQTSVSYWTPLLSRK